jgi:hypothetical protein
MGKSNIHGSKSNGLLNRLLVYVLTSVIVPFAIKIIKKKLDEKQRLVCYKCHGKLEIINKREYYCKNCKIIRIDNN